MKANDTMHSILSNLSEAIALLDSLTAEKSFTKDEWPRILKQDSSPSTAAAWQTRLCIFQSSRMEDNHNGEEETRLALNKKITQINPVAKHIESLYNHNK